MVSPAPDLSPVGRLWNRVTTGQRPGRSQGLMGLGMIVATVSGLFAIAPPATALEEVQLTYGDLQSNPIPLADLESFAFGGTPSQDLELLLDILDLDSALAQEFLTREIPIEMDGIRRVSETFMGQMFWRVVESAISLNNTTGEGWQHLRDALLNAAADNRITLLEVLQNIEAGLMVIDTQRLFTLVTQVQPDIEAIQSVFSAGEEPTLIKD
jgi:hypothetical protein